jgi:dTDP-4-dehydrorhamnose reductase
MSWLIVGGGGQLGTALAEVLSTSKVSFNSLSSADLDIRSSRNTLDLIEKLSPQVIINAAAWTDVDGAESNPEFAYAVNTKGALNLSIAARDVNAIFLHVSTDYIFSGSSNRPWREDDSPSPASVYGRSKAAAEVEVLREYAQGSYIFRTAWLYSKWGKNFAKTMVRLALTTGDSVEVVNDQVGQPTSALDLAERILLSIQSGLPFGIYHATNSGQASWFEFAQEIFKWCDGGVPSNRVLRSETSSSIRSAKRPAYSVLGHSAWNAIGQNGESLGAMRDWKIALQDALPAIISEVQAEG